MERAIGSHANPHDYQPTNITFGIMEPPPQHIRDKQKRKLAISERALADLETCKQADLTVSTTTVGVAGVVPTFRSADTA